MQTLAPAIMLIYGGILIAGGVIGWRVSGSRISLTASLASAALLAIAYRISLGAPFAGYLMATIVALGLAVLFTLRLRKTGKFMPAGLMLALSCIAAVLFGWVAALSRSGR